MSRIVIIGNGISGITAARHIRKKSDHEIMVISAESDYFFSRTALMYIFMGHMKFEHTKPYEDWFWKKNRISLKRGFVKNVESSSKELHLEGGEKIQFDKLIIATGSSPNKFGWPGQELTGVQGLYSLQDLELMEENTKGVTRAVIVGGGLIGIEMAEMLHSRNIHVTFLVRESSFWDNILPAGESNLINRHIVEHGVDLRLATELKEIHGNERGVVRSVLTSKGEIVKCDFVGLTVGVTPNVSFLTNSDIEMDKGILVDEFLETNVADVYAIGDCAQHRKPPSGRRAIEQVWYTGRKMGETVAQTLCGRKTPYSPGHWFNSAKFFDIEYQTYGLVANKLQEHERSFYWEDDSGKKCMHFVFSKNADLLIGVNTFGIRLRHEVFDRWLSEKRSMDYVMDNLAEANFDPEFFKRHEKEIKEKWVKDYKKHQQKVKT